MFYVYYGYVNADNYDASEGPVYKIEKLNSEEEVLAFLDEFNEGVYDECSNTIFRVFEGTERSITVKSVVSKYELV